MDSREFIPTLPPLISAQFGGLEASEIQKTGGIIQNISFAPKLPSPFRSFDEEDSLRQHQNTSPTD
jgi:hypothetical protein